MANYTLVDTYIARDEMSKANQSLLEMLKVGEKSDQLMIIIPALCELAVVRKIEGKPHQAKELYDRAYQWLLDHDSLDYRLRCSYEFGLADLLREWNHLDTAYEHALIGDEYRQRLGGYQMTGDLVLMRIHQARGDVQGALEALRKAEQIMEAHQLQLATTIEFKTERVLQHLAFGDVEKANHWAKEFSHNSEREHITLARLYLVQGEAARALRLLEIQRVLAEAGGRNCRLIEILILQALALNQQDHLDEAAQSLSQALYLAQPANYVRIFLDLGQPLYELLEKVGARDTVSQKNGTAVSRITRDYARDLLKAFQDDGQFQAPQTDQDQALVDPLTDRELEVLRWLAAGFTNKVIAGKLIVAPSTVKQHLKNIYGKLDVHNRTQAVARGRELGLL
jgi:LuxR family transcriptional regulator, maltose regulon positive regulatory protein